MLRQILIEKALFIVVATNATVGCRDSTAPDAQTGRAREALVVAASDSTSVTSLVVVDPETEAISSSLTVAGPVAGAAAASDGSRAYFTVQDLSSAGNFALYALDQTGAMAWSLPLAANWEALPGNETGVLSGSAMTLSADGQRLYAWLAIHDSTRGIAAVNMATRRLAAFSGPWNVAAGGVEAWPEAHALVVVGARQDVAAQPRQPFSIYLMSDRSLQITDSIPVISLGMLPDESVWQVVPSHDGHTLYVATSARILQYDVQAHQLRSSVPRPGSGSLAITGDGQTLLMTDAGRWPDSPGSGLVYRFDSNLNSLGTIDVSSALGGRPNSTLAIVTGTVIPSGDGHTMYVNAGSPAGALFPPQPARILTVDANQGVVTKVIDLPGDSRGLVLLHS